MQRLGFVLAVAVAIACAGCDTSQPEQHTGVSSAEVRVEARATVSLVDCYDQYNNDVFDRVICFPAPGTSFQQRPVPWRFSFRVIKLPAGSTEFEIVESSVNRIDEENPALGGTFGSVTPFDTETSSALVRPDQPPLSWRDGRRVSKGHRDWFLGRPEGAITLPTPNILGVTEPASSPRYPFDIAPGEAVIVEGAKQLRGQGFPIFEEGVDPSLLLSSQMLINGVPVTPTAGSTGSGTADGSGFSFQFLSD